MKQKPAEEPFRIEDDEICEVRRICPTETSRLQGFPDNYTKIDGPETTDAPQYKAHGNSWATPCANYVSVRSEMELRRLGHKGTIRYATCCSGIEAHSVAVKDLDWKALFFSEIEPFPCRVLAKHYPTVPNLGDMTQIRYDAEKGVITNKPEEGYSLDAGFLRAPEQGISFKEGEMEVFSGGTPCFTAGHMVLTEKGYIPIEEVKVGDKVVTHLGNLKKVVAIGKKRADNIIRVKARSRYAIEVTDNHPFWSMIGRRDYRRSSSTYMKVLLESPSWREAGCLNYDTFLSLLDTDKVLSPVPIPTFPTVYNATQEDIAELMGWYIGDGYIRGFTGKKKKAVVLCLSPAKVDKFKAVFGTRVKFSTSKQRTAIKVHIYCSALASFLTKELGELSYKKRIPAWLIFASKNIKDRFIAGYLATDGCKNKKEEKWTTTSPSLAFGIAQLINESCVSFHKAKPTSVIEGRVVNQRNQYLVNHSFGKKNLHKYGIWNFVRVQTIEPSNPNTVYNIEVEGDHSYICNGYCVHNCQDLSVAGLRRGMAEGTGTRSSLAFAYQRIIDETKPQLTIWEQVPGAFSSNGGKDFLWFVNRCAESGYAMAWRVLDAQYVMTEEFPRAVPQRRRRIWMVGYRGNDWRVPVRILFEKERDLGAEPPERVPGLGFKTLFTDVDVEKIRRAAKDKKKNNEEGDLFSFFAETAPAPKILKVSQMIPLEEMPDEADFSRVPLMELHDFVSKVGTPTFIGTLFRQDKKTAMDCLLEDEKERLRNGDEDIARMYENIQALVKEGKIKWEGAELINPGALEDIGNAGIVANGRICLLKCHEWTSGIQLSPTTYKAWEEVMKNNHLDYAKANALLPAAYDETVCGLSDVLVDDPAPKYNLSWRACYGILRRAVTRGKLLPMALKVALVYTLRESAGVVKWVALNGRDTAKEGCESERAIAKDCYDRYIEEVMPFDKVEAVAPSRASAEDSEDFNDNDEEGSGEGDPEEEDNEGFGVFTAPKKEEPPADAGATEDGTPYEVPSTEDVTTRDFLAQYSDNASSGVLTAGTYSAHKGVFCGRETSPNIVASQYKGPGNTQDGTIVGHVYKATE